MRNRLLAFVLVLALTVCILPAGVLADDQEPAPGTYYACWNINDSSLGMLLGLDAEGTARAQAEIRSAISLLIDRQAIVKIVPTDVTPAASFVAKGITDAQGREFYKSAGAGGGYFGYYDTAVTAYDSNVDQAVTILKNYYTFNEITGQFTDFPEITYIYNSEGDVHTAIGKSIQSDLGKVGIPVKLEALPWTAPSGETSYIDTINAGNYTFARNGWIVEENDPLAFLETCKSDSPDNFAGFGKGELGQARIYSIDLTGYGLSLKVDSGTWAETYDALIDLIKDTTDADMRDNLLHDAEDLLMSTGCICPLYFYPYPDIPDPVPPIAFEDVPSKAYYNDAVAWAVRRGVTKGKSDTTFAPDDDCTRAEVVTFLWRAVGSPSPTSTENPFTDVTGGYSYNAILWAAESGITKGVTPTTFGPTETCTREQVVTFLYRTMSQPDFTNHNSPFSDVSSSSFAYNAILWAVENGITNGTSSDAFSPKETCTRAQIVTFLFRTLE